MPKQEHTELEDDEFGGMLDEAPTTPEEPYGTSAKQSQGED